MVFTLKMKIAILFYFLSLFQAQSYNLQGQVSRRGFGTAFAAGAAVLASSESALAASKTAPSSKVKTVLVLGSSGMVGKEVVKRLESLNIKVVGTSSDGRAGTKPVKFSSKNVEESIALVSGYAKGVDAIISCVGSFNTPEDFYVNQATGLIAAAVKIPVTYISVAPEVMASVEGLPILTEYMKGKSFSNAKVIENGGSLIQPTFIYGGENFGINPPRVTSTYGGLIESILGSGPIRGLAGVSPGLIKVALEPPVSAEAVAGSAVAKCLGFEGSASTHDGIVSLAAKL